MNQMNFHLQNILIIITTIITLTPSPSQSMSSLSKTAVDTLKSFGWLLGKTSRGVKRVKASPLAATLKEQLSSLSESVKSEQQLFEKELQRKFKRRRERRLRATVILNCGTFFAWGLLFGLWQNRHNSPQKEGFDVDDLGRQLDVKKKLS
ncbi:hypothetical protein TYRP_020319 [Tyrophagus putrescentiae]|nr:hypothetical protein TYRP_020319 [Tyrophagus putrescentiae]